MIIITKTQSKCYQLLFSTILISIGDSFLDNIIAIDETPLSLYVPDSRSESKEWNL